MTGDEYIAVLEQRRAEAAPAGERFPALLEWFVRPGDEELFTPPEPPVRMTPPKVRMTRPRARKTRTELTAERDRLTALQAPLAEPVFPETAAAHGVALGPRRTAKAAAAQDQRLARWAHLQRRIDALNHRIATTPEETP